MSAAQAEIPHGHPMRDAWEAYKVTGDFANTRQWALREEHVDGSLWAEFNVGFNCARSLTATPAGSSVDLSQFLQAVEALKREGIREQTGGFTSGDPGKIACAERLLQLIESRATAPVAKFPFDIIEDASLPPNVAQLRNSDGKVLATIVHEALATAPAGDDVVGMHAPWCAAVAGTRGIDGFTDKPCDCGPADPAGQDCEQELR